MSHGIKVFASESGFANFVASAEGWTAYGAGSSVGAAQALTITNPTTSAGGQSALLTLVGSLTPVRATVLYKTNDSSQTCNVNIVDQGNTVLASTTFPASQFGADYNDYKRAVVDVSVPTGTTGVRARVAQGNDVDGSILLDKAAIQEGVLLTDPDSVSRRAVPTRAVHSTLSGRRVVDVLQRHYTLTYSWNVMDAGTYDRVAEYFYRNEPLWIDDGEVPPNQEVHAVYMKGLMNHTNAQSVAINNGAGTTLSWHTVIDSLLPNATGFGTDTSPWTVPQIGAATSTLGHSFQTSVNSAYTFLHMKVPTTGSGNMGLFDMSATMVADIIHEVRSTAPGEAGFDVWMLDYTAGQWRKIRTVPRSGETAFVLDMRSTDLITDIVNAADVGKRMEFMFQTRSTDFGPGATIVVKNWQLIGNAGFDHPDVVAADMGTRGAHVIDTVTQPITIDYVLLDSRGTFAERPPTTLTAGVDYTSRPDGLALSLPATNASSDQINGGALLVRYSRDLLCLLEALPDTWYHTGALTDHDRRVALTFTTLRTSTHEEFTT